CSYVCPSKIPLVHYFRFAKTEIMNQQQETLKSDNARIRHDNRQQRLELEKKEKEQRQRQRKAALAATKAAKEKEQAQKDSSLDNVENK
ncbi:MAG: electron transport complex subunit RsxC, partial [Methylophagaceae bacterium]